MQKHDNHNGGLGVFFIFMLIFLSFLGLVIYGIKLYVDYTYTENKDKNEFKKNSIAITATIPEYKSVEQEKINNKIPKEVNENEQISKNQIVIDNYKNIYKSYQEQLKNCTQEEEQYKIKAKQKKLDERVILKQYKSLHLCYQTLQLIISDLDYMHKNTTDISSEKLQNELNQIKKNYSKNKKFINHKVLLFETKM